MNKILKELNDYLDCVHKKGELTDCPEVEKYRALAHEAIESTTVSVEIGALTKILEELDNLHDICALDNTPFVVEEGGDGFGLGV